jgi:hypothetical protein
MIGLESKIPVSIAIEIFSVVPRWDKCFTVLRNYVEKLND